MAKVSVIIPARNEPYLAKTVDGVFANATGEIEVIVVAGGSSLFPLPIERPNLTIIHNPTLEGVRVDTNRGVAAATGKYLLRLDAHCIVDKGFDEELQRECDIDWLVMPRRYGMNDKLADPWQPIFSVMYDYYYYTFPWTNDKGFIFSEQRWTRRQNQRIGHLIDETMAIHGSAWFMEKRYFTEQLEGLDNQQFGLWGDSQEVALKTWLGGGKVMVNKKTWYAHLKVPGTETLHIKNRRMIESHTLIAKYWTENRWAKRVHDFDWLVEKFWPLPTESNHSQKETYHWPENWKDYYGKS